MRVIAGKYRGRKLAEFEKIGVRPTSDRAKEGIFSAIQFEIEGKSFYDAFCGSGAMGIEALSRGASEAVFTDVNQRSVELTNKNLQSLGERCRAQRIDCLEYLKRTDKKFDFIFLDPPYASDVGEKALELIARRNILTDNGCVIMERGNAFNGVIDGLFVSKRKKYGIAEISFLKKVKQKAAVFAGSFDPVTRGHVHVVEKALEVYERVIVAMGVNADKQYYFDKYTRMQMLEAAFKDMPRVEVVDFDGYLVDFLKSRAITDNVRGIRNDCDIRYEEQMLEVNRQMYPEIKNVYVYCDKQFELVSSSLVKSLIKEGKDFAGYLPEAAAEIAVKRVIG